MFSRGVMFDKHCDYEENRQSMRPMQTMSRRESVAGDGLG